ncbi:MAG TPA: hypothetical protein DDW52_30060, partial [Planctomycetaceae bacterium]|nr:hypothetical protein [Planctomycetaceae bacterium]
MPELGDKRSENSRKTISIESTAVASVSLQNGWSASKSPAAILTLINETAVVRSVMTDRFELVNRFFNEWQRNVLAGCSFACGSRFDGNCACWRQLLRLSRAAPVAVDIRRGATPELGR